MPTVTMPQLGESVTEGTILQWLKKPGDPVALDESLCEIETEKVTAELPSPFEGTMGAILVAEGDTVDVGTPLCEIAGEGAAVVVAEESAVSTASGGWTGGPMAIPPDERAPDEEQPKPLVTARSGRNGQGARGAGKPDERSRFHSPAVLRLAREHSIDPSAIPGSGVGGRVTRKDVEQWVAREPAERGAVARAERTGAPTGEYEVVALSPTRRTIAENLKRSNLEAPQAWTMVEADVSPLVALREREKERFLRAEGVELTLLPYFTASVAETLREFPMLNARWEGQELRRYAALHLGVAIATERGLVVPNVRNAGDLSVAGLARAIADLVERAHSRKLRVEDIEGGTFTVNNTGSFGSIASKPIVNHPQVGIVTMERVVKRAVVVGGDAIAVRSMVNVCLSFDHRALDGLEAGQFLAALKRRLEAVG
ncbi:MAG: dihydrolipoamide acetyltransferase family protein [Dehalococcoidia bacterium]